MIALTIARVRVTVRIGMRYFWCLAQRWSGLGSMVRLRTLLLACVNQSKRNETVVTPTTVVTGVATGSFVSD